MGLLQNLPSPAFSFTDTHSLFYNFTVDPHPSPGEPWCVVQGQVDGNVFLSYHCGGTKIQSISPLGEEVKTTNAWETQTETLRDIRDWIKDHMHDFTLEKHMPRGELESPSAEGADWGLKLVHCFWVKNKMEDIVPSLVVQWKEQALEEGTGPE